MKIYQELKKDESYCVYKFVYISYLFVICRNYNIFQYKAFKDFLIFLTMTLIDKKFFSKGVPKYLCHLTKVISHTKIQ